MGVAAAIAGAAVIGGVATNVASNKASKAQGKASDAAIGATKQAVTEARADVNRIFPEAQATANLGFQGALDVFGQSVPAQFDVFQQGNAAAQQALISGLPQIQNAILGGNIDLSGLQPFQAQNVPTDLFQQQAPVNIQRAAQARQAGIDTGNRMAPTNFLDRLSNNFNPTNFGETRIDAANMLGTSQGGTGRNIFNAPFRTR